MDIFNLAARLYLGYRYRAGPLRRRLAGRQAAGRARAAGLKVAALQVEFCLHRTAVEYFEHMNSLAEKAAAEGAVLVVFPENIHLPLYGLLPGIEEKFGGKGDGGPEDPAEEGKRLRENLMLLGPFVKGIYLETFRSLARLYRLYVLGGSITMPEEGELYNIAYLFGPEGEIIGRQKKLHLTPEEEAFGLKTGNRLDVYDLPFGRVAFPVCMDATYFETFEILREKGVDLVMIPVANMEEYHSYRALRGIWPRVQESGVIGIRSTLAGKVAGFYFTGRAGIFAPLELTEHKNGVIKEAEHFLGDDVVTAEVDLEALRKYREEEGLLGDRNPELYRKYLGRLYRPPAGRG